MYGKPDNRATFLGKATSGMWQSDPHDGTMVRRCYVSISDSALRQYNAVHYKDTRHHRTMEVGNILTVGLASVLEKWMSSQIPEHTAIES
jgi:hypothetical protein